MTRYSTKLCFGNNAGIANNTPAIANVLRFIKYPLAKQYLPSIYYKYSGSGEISSIFSHGTLLIPKIIFCRGYFFVTGFVQTLFAEPEKIKLKKSENRYWLKPAKLPTCNRSLAKSITTRLVTWVKLKPDLVRSARACYYRVTSATSSVINTWTSYFKVKSNNSSVSDREYYARVISGLLPSFPHSIINLPASFFYTN